MYLLTFMELWNFNTQKYKVKTTGKFNTFYLSLFKYSVK